MITDPKEYISYLKEIQDSSVTMYTTLPLTEPRFLIDANTRTITIPSKFPFLAIRYDHRAETIYFEIDRYFDNTDLSEHTCIVQFINKNKDDYYEGISLIKHMDIESVEGKIILGWTIENTATKLAGDIAFCVRFFSIDERDNFTYNFNTLPARSTISDTLTTIATDDYMDTSVLEVWISKIDTLATKMCAEEQLRVEAEDARVIAEENRQVATTNAIAKMKSDTQAAINSANLAVENAIDRVNTETEIAIEATKAAINEAVGSIDIVLANANKAAINADNARNRLENLDVDLEFLPAGSEATGSIIKTETGIIFNLSVPKGDKGTKGDTGEGFKVLDYFNTLNELKAAVPNPEIGVAYGVGTNGSYDIYIYGETSGWVNNGKLQGAKGDNGNDGITFTPYVSKDGMLYWTNDGDLENPDSVNIKGENGVTFTPSVSEDGVLSWTNNGGLTNPTSVNINGYTPQKGVDYMTEEDKAEIAEQASESISISVNNVTVNTSSWVDSIANENYPYQATITISDTTEDMTPEVYFSFADAVSNNFAPVANSVTNGVVIYAKNKPDISIIVQKIILWK